MRKTRFRATGQQSFARTFAYDNMNRILSMTDGASNQSCKGLSWIIDAWGNMVDQTTTSGSCYNLSSSAATNNRLNSYTYDAAGNVTYDGTHHYTYDAEGRVLEVDGGSTASYVYNENGQRVRKNTGSTWTEYYYGPGGNVQSEYNGSWPVQYVYAGSRLLAIYQNGTTDFVHADQLGSTRLITAVNQSIVDNMDYEPFGQQTAGGSATSHKFTGKQRDGEDGLDYFGARYYSSSMGRFMTPDWSSRPEGVPYAQLDNPQSLNLYGYVGNDPHRNSERIPHLPEILTDFEGC
ncbi:MAG TPA: RHS repeat-associated core domain-containing protein [Acidobacteriaceae bacterium]|nr:RHS repeat-associated core domain-containing protein [Acidobacteriaceae bacterium]